MTGPLLRGREVATGYQLRANRLKSHEAGEGARNMAHRADLAVQLAGGDARTRA